MVDEIPQEIDFGLRGLRLDPVESWQRLCDFLGVDDTTVYVMRRTSEILLQGAADFVVATYDYLSKFDETASILGWEHGMDETHLQERRQFFSTWIARTIGVDLSDEFAMYLFKAGVLHAGHGPRQIHTPEMWVLGSVGMVQAHFATAIVQSESASDIKSGAIAGWNKYLMLQAQQMLAGYQVALAIDQGPLSVRVRLYGELRELAPAPMQVVHIHEGAVAGDALRKYFDYVPGIRRAVLQESWQTPADNSAATWVTDLEKVYVPKGGPHTHMALNGRDLNHHEGLDSTLHDGDELALFPSWVSIF